MKSVYASPIYWINVFDRMWRTAIEFGLGVIIAIFSEAILEHKAASVDLLLLVNWMVIGAVLSVLLSFMFPKKVAGIIEPMPMERDRKTGSQKKHRRSRFGNDSD